MRLSVTTRIVRSAALFATLSAALTLPAFAADANSTWTPDMVPSVSSPSATLNIPDVRPRMSPELALNVHENRSARQARELGEYNDVTTIDAELPQTAQKGRYRLHRIYSAPKTLAFKTIDFVGDGFVKANVIARLLQSEVDHAQKDDNQTTAITAANYKYSYKGVDTLDGQPVHVFAVKPRENRSGLFKGKIYLDAYTGAMRRAEGTMVKSPSFFVKNIQFVQDYAQVNRFDMISHIHSTADTRIIGKAIVDITHDEYQAHSLAEIEAASSPAPTDQAPTVRTVSFSTDSQR